MREVAGARLVIFVLVGVTSACASDDAVFERSAATGGASGSANSGDAGRSGAAQAGGVAGAGGSLAHTGGRAGAAGASSAGGGGNTGAASGEAGAATGDGGSAIGGGSGMCPAGQMLCPSCNGDGARCYVGQCPATSCPPCSTVTTLEACESRADCHSVFVDPGTCKCAAIGCCAKFSACADGDRADCKGEQLECDAKTPNCESPAFVVSYVGFCYEGCVAPEDCAP